jgi:phosphonate transport system substrate-binding protein
MRFVAALTTAVLLCSIPGAWAEAPPEGYTFGIGPVQSATELAKHWTPFMEYLTKKSGVPLQFKTAKDISTYQQQLREGVYDFGYINPYHYLEFNKSSGYKAFAREKDGKLLGILVVKEDSPIHDLSQLNDQTIAFPSANAMVATWLAVNMLQKKNIKTTPQYVNSMDSVYLSVARGLFPAGGGETRTFGTFNPEVKSKLRILWTSEALPPFPFMSHPRVPKSVVAKVQQAMEQMANDPEGMALLKANNFTGIERTNDADYNAMRKMNIQPMKVK